MMEESLAEQVGRLTREPYLARIRPFYEKYDLVKVITGIRRSGKSVLVTQIADELRRTVAPERIIELNFELMDYAAITTAEALDSYVASRIDESRGPCYVFLDEVQVVPQFERAVNSLRARGGVSLFITGSNGALLSGELATVLAGRYVEFRVWPLSYAESLELRGIDQTASTPALLTDYMTWGGLPQRFALGQGQGETRAYLRDVFNSVVLRDIVQRTGIRDVAILEEIVTFAMENLGRVLSPSSLTGYLKAHGRRVASDTIYSYLRAMTDSLLFNRVSRYDLRGKHVMATLDKYYATDLGILASKRAGTGPGLGDIIENVVFVELSARGFDITTGITSKGEASAAGEIDFVAVKNGTPCYVQVAYLIATPEVADREFGAFATLRDGYPRFVISLDPITQDRDGVRHLTLEEFLLRPPAELA